MPASPAKIAENPSLSVENMRVQSRERCAQKPTACWIAWLWVKPFIW